MFYTLAILLLFQCVGELIALGLALSIPGSVIGMVLLFFALLASPRLMEKVEESSHHILKHMSLFFIPAGVGIMVSAAGVMHHWLAVVIAIMSSTLLTLAITAISMRCLMNSTPPATDEVMADKPSTPSSLDQ
jgi:putative effector of murein hydrolase LrgA (UPF0299 family)